MIQIAKINQADLPELALLLTELSGKKTDLDKMEKNFLWMEDNEDYHHRR